MRQGHGSVRAAVLGTAALLGGLGSVAGLAAAVPGRDAAAPASLALLTTSQENMTRAGYVRVRVRAHGAGMVRVFAMARRDAPGAALRRLTVSRLLRFHRRGSRVVRLRLTPFGRSAAAGCDALRMSANARARDVGTSRPRRLPASVRRGRPPARCAGRPGAKGTSG